MRVLFLCNSLHRSRHARLWALTRQLPQVGVELILIDKLIQITGPAWRRRQDGRNCLLDECDLVVHWPVSFQERRAGLASTSYAGKEYIERKWVALEHTLLSSIPAACTFNPYSHALIAANKALVLPLATPRHVRVSGAGICNHQGTH